MSVFETTIRVLGGLLSGHLLAVDASLNLTTAYDGELLALALDLGERLAPAFETPTSIPYGTVNLRYGIPRGETPVASLAGAGSLSIEFGVLSALTAMEVLQAKPRERRGRCLIEDPPEPVRQAHQRPIGQVGRKSQWRGPNSDSFYGNLRKSRFSSSRTTISYRMFEEAYSAIDATTRQGDWFADVEWSLPRRWRLRGGVGVASTASARRCSTPSSSSLTRRRLPTQARRKT